MATNLTTVCRTHTDHHRNAVANLELFGVRSTVVAPEEDLSRANVGSPANGSVIFSSVK